MPGFNFGVLATKADEKIVRAATSVHQRIPTSVKDKTSQEVANVSKRISEAKARTFEKPGVQKAQARTTEQLSKAQARVMQNPQVVKALQNQHVVKALSWTKDKGALGSTHVSLFMQHNFPGISQWFSKTFANTRPMT